MRYVTHPCQLPATPGPMLQLKRDLWWQAKSNPSQIHRYQPASSEARFSERWEWAFHHHHQLAPSEARATATDKPSFAPTSEARSTATSFLPAKPECERCVSEHSTATSVLPANPDPLLPTKPDPPPTACSQRSQIVGEVRVSIPPLPAWSQRSPIHCYKRSQIHR